MKDNFSKQAATYARYRPGYPAELFQWMNGLTQAHDAAWDCATGNGQIASGLSAFFNRVYATDISERQLAEAVQAPNIIYSAEAAEQASFDDNTFDLVVVAQALHWFNFDAFYREVKRCLKPEGVFVITGYAMPRTRPETDAVIDHFYEEVVGAYWDPERRYVDEGYRTVPFPFEELETPGFAYETSWDINHILGYVESWSAVQHYIKAQGHSPLPALRAALEKCWRPEGEPIRFPLLLRAGRLTSGS